MGQIISSLFSFFLEVGRSGKNYKTNRSRSKAANIIIGGLITFAIFIAGESFFSAYVVQADNIKLKAEVASLKKLQNENYELKIRNEVLSATLIHFLGKNLVDKINQEQNSGLKDRLGKEAIQEKVQEAISLDITSSIHKTK